MSIRFEKVKFYIDDLLKYTEEWNQISFLWVGGTTTMSWTFAKVVLFRREPSCVLENDVVLILEETKKMCALLLNHTSNIKVRYLFLKIWQGGSIYSTYDRVRVFWRGAHFMNSNALYENTTFKISNINMSSRTRLNIPFVCVSV